MLHCTRGPCCTGASVSCCCQDAPRVYQDGLAAYAKSSRPKAQPSAPMMTALAPQGSALPLSQHGENHVETDSGAPYGCPSGSLPTLDGPARASPCASLHVILSLAPPFTPTMTGRHPALSCNQQVPKPSKSGPDPSSNTHFCCFARRFRNCESFIWRVHATTQAIMPPVAARCMQSEEASSLQKTKKCGLSATTGRQFI